MIKLCGYFWRKQSKAQSVTSKPTTERGGSHEPVMRLGIRVVMSCEWRGYDEA